MRTLSAYVHIPFCASRCGYCDFNTYTAAELQRDGTSITSATYPDRVIAEVNWLRHANATDDRALSTVFFGGGTPTLIDSKELVRILHSLKSAYGFTDDAEITTEANPDSVSRQDLEILRAGGFTRISFGHQSSAKNVLALLERTHTPGKTWEAVSDARSAGFEHVSVDLIYGSPGETDADLAETLDQVSAADIDHVSAYSLIVEPGTRLAARVARGEIPNPSDDVAAHRYELIDEKLRSLEMTWYEVSNWSKPNGECRHNIAYWKNQDWLGIGPGAHAHANGTRSWNLKHPAAWAAKVDEGVSAIADSEVLTQMDVNHEDIMLGLRLREGLSLSVLGEAGLDQARLAVTEGLLEPNSFAEGKAVLTFQGRLLADGLVARLWA
ncbi:MAG: coproporphyrinogen III oxidase [Actinobacteria bacterium]|nr:coproporphyrinogen III oxidase [Actinomycetota bacterium]NBO34850.1 coproporphyrinogen III oxidase [Actinomycetota bacterium]